MTILRQNVVEPGDAAPPAGVPFDPAANFDQDVNNSVKVMKRGDKTTVLSSVGDLTEDAIEGPEGGETMPPIGIKPKLQAALDAVAEIKPAPKVRTPAEQLLDQMVADGIVDPASDKPNAPYKDYQPPQASSQPAS